MKQLLHRTLYPKLNKFKHKLLLCLSLIVFINIFSPNSGFAEGTKELSPTSGDRTFLRTGLVGFGEFAKFGALPESSLYFHIDDAANEKLYLACKADNNSTVYAIIRNINGDIVWPSAGVLSGQDISTLQINAGSWQWTDLTYDAAVAGPSVVVGNTGYRNSSVFDPNTLGLPKGDYSIEFSAIQTSASGTYNIEFFDFTVVKSGSAIKGRLFSKNWCFRTPNISTNYDRNFNGKLYSFCPEIESDGVSRGYVTEVDFNGSGFRGLSFNTAFNAWGTDSSNDFKINRQSFNNDNKLAPDYNIFLNNPDPNIYLSATEFGSFITDGDEYPKFFGCPPTVPGDDANYFFRVKVDKKGRVEILLDLNGNDDVYTDGTEDVMLYGLINPYEGESTPYTRDIYWNGKNGLGTTVNLSTGTTVKTVFEYCMGTFHFPMYDVEYLLNGIKPSTFRPVLPNPLYEVKLYWDDSNIPDNSGVSQPKVVFTGEATPSHKWNQVAYGNSNSINTYWNSYSTGGSFTKEFVNPTAGCGVYTPTEISGIVFTDSDSDGVKDTGETGKSGVAVRLFKDTNTNGTFESGTDEELTPAITNTNGEYKFLPEIGFVYFTKIEAPVSFEVTTSPNLKKYEHYLDGAMYQDQDFGVALINQAPLLPTNTLTIKEGETVAITNAFLNSTDVDNTDTELTYTITSIVNGVFKKSGTIVTTFTKKDVEDGLISFVHDGGEAAPSYHVKVTDTGNKFSEGDVHVTFTNVNDAPVYTSNAS
ncbi:cadherin-like domain-containing protein, partial [Ancylomarina sp. YFZ004]